MYLSGVFKSQWASLWGHSSGALTAPSRTDRHALHDDNDVDDEDGAAAAVGTPTAVSSAPIVNVADEPPLRKRPRTCDDHHTANANVAVGGGLQSDATPRTTRAGMLYPNNDEDFQPLSFSEGGEAALWRSPNIGLCRQVAASRVLAPPTAVDAAHVLSHIWFRMMRDQQRASPTYIITSEDDWVSSVNCAARRYVMAQHDPCAPVATTLVSGVAPQPREAGAGLQRLSTRHAAAVARSDDDDRWVPVLQHLANTHQSQSYRGSDRPSAFTYHIPPPPFSSSTTVCSPQFDTSIDAVRCLMLRLIDAETYMDPSLWLVALVYADRMHHRCHLYEQHRDHHQTLSSASSCDDEDDDVSDVVQTPATFRFYRRHELRILFSLFTLAVKQTSDLYVTVRNVHRVLPSYITSYEPPIREAPGGHGGHSPSTVNALPQSLWQKFPHIAQRLEASLLSEEVVMNRHHKAAGACSTRSVSPQSPPFTLPCAARVEASILRDGLGYRTLVRRADLNHLLSRYASAKEAALLERYMQHHIRRADA